MTESDEKRRVVFPVRCAKISKDRLELGATVVEMSTGQAFDAIIEEWYNRLVAEGKIREYMKKLQSLESDIVS